MIVVKLNAPSAWASYLVNGDDSGIDPEDRARADAWIAAEDMGGPVSCDDAGFCKWHDAWAVCPLESDCQEYVFLIPDSEIRAMLYA